MKAVLSKLIALVLVCTLISGCSGAREPNDLAYVLAIGIDKGKHDKLRVTFQIANTKVAAAGNTGGGGGDKPVIVASVEGPTIFACMNLLNTVTSRPITLAHCKIIFYGEALAKEDMAKYVAPLVRFKELRKTIFVNVAIPNAEECINKTMPLLEMNPSKYYELKPISQNETSLFKQTMMKDFYKDFKSVTADAVTAIIGVNDGKQEEKEHQVPQPENYPSFLPGQIPRKGEMPIESIGCAIFSKTKMVGQINGDETRTLLMLQGLLRQGYYVLPDPRVPNSLITLLIKQGKKPDVQMDLKNNVIRQTIYLEGEIAAIESSENYEKPELKTLLEDHFNKLTQSKCQNLLAKLQQDWQSDAVGYGVYARSQFLTYAELTKLDWLDRVYPAIDIQVEIKTIIRRTGLILKTTPAPGQPESED